MKRILSALLLALLAAGMIFAGGSQEAEAASSAAVSSGDGKYVVLMQKDLEFRRIRCVLLQGKKMVHVLLVNFIQFGLQQQDRLITFIYRPFQLIVKTDSPQMPLDVPQILDMSENLV